MASRTPSHSHLTPATLLVGNSEGTQAETVSLLHEELCGCPAEVSCTIAHKIKSRQHHAVWWITPESGYTVSILEPLIYQLSLALSENETFFFILGNAHQLSGSCTGMLLKPLEEPPMGYHFILTTDRPGEIAPTIISRCATRSIATAAIAQHYTPLIKALTTIPIMNATRFLQLLKQSELSTADTQSILDQVLTHWVDQQVVALREDNKSKAQQYVSIIEEITRMLNRSITPGSGKIIAKQLFLTTQQTVSESNH